MHPAARDYSQYVLHPRFGQSPRFTGLDPDPDAHDVHLHWNTRFSDDGSRLVPGTAIPADLSRQQPATIPATHYYDIDKVCRDCGLRFIFFAQEQKYWYEELGFPLDSDAVRCQVCRRRTQHVARLRKRYEQLSQAADKTEAEQLEMADCCLTLVNEGIFHGRQLEHVRELLNGLPDDRRSSAGFQDLEF